MQSSLTTEQTDAIEGFLRAARIKQQTHLRAMDRVVVENAVSRLEQTCAELNPSQLHKT